MENVRWTGKSGQEYTFENYLRVGTEFNSVAGVYILCRQVNVTQYGALYVGETETFYDRLNANAVNHDGFKRASEIGFTHISTLRCDNYAQRLAIETDLRHGLNPICNQQSIPARM